MNLIHRYLRVTHSGRLADRFLTAQISTGESFEKPQYGSLYSLVEIVNRSFAATQVGQSIVNALRREYFKTDSTSDLENFEKAVKKVNEHLARLAVIGQTEWINHTNAALALVSGANLHLTVTGEISAWLYRAGEITPVAKPRFADDLAPAKTFETITSGSLEAGDRVIICSSDIIKHLTASELAESLGQTNLYQSSLSIIRKLKRIKVKNIGFFAVEVVPEGSVPATYPEVIYLDKPIETPFAVAAKFTAKITKLMVIYGGKTAHFVKTRVAPAVAAKTRQQAKILLDKAAALTSKSHSQASRSSQASDVEGLSLIGKTIFNIHDYTAPKPKRRFTITLPKIQPLWRQRAALALRQKRNRPLVLVAAVLALVFILIISISIQRKNQTKNADQSSSKSSLEDTRRRLEEGKTALVFNNKAQAQLAFADAVVLAKAAIDSPTLADDAKNLLNEAEVELDKLVGSNRIKGLNALVSFDSAAAIVEQNGKIIAWDQGKNKLMIGALAGGKSETVAGFDGKLSGLTTAADKVFVATDKAFYVLHPDKKNLSQVDLAESAAVKKGAALAHFIGNLYLLSPADNQVWKYQLKDGVYQKETGFLKIKTNLSNAKDLAIDGTIYVLEGGGKILKLSGGGAAQNLNLTGLPKGLEKIEKPIAIFTSEETGSIFAADGGGLPRLLEFDKQGKFVQQFLFQSDLADFKDIWFAPKARKAWALFGNSVYEINL